MGAMPAEFDIAVRILNPAWRRLWPAAAAGARSAARTVLDRALKGPLFLSVDVVEMAIVLAHDGEVRRLTCASRASAKPTSVLSFGSSGDRRRRVAGEPVILGDVILARETVAAEAATHGKSRGHHALYQP